MSPFSSWGAQSWSNFSTQVQLYWHLEVKLYCGRSGPRSAGASCQQRRAASTDIYHPPPHTPSGLGFFTLHTNLPRELNARTLSETLERYQQKSKLRLRHLKWVLLMLRQSFQKSGKGRDSHSMRGRHFASGEISCYNQPVTKPGGTEGGLCHLHPFERQTRKRAHFDPSAAHLWPRAHAFSSIGHAKTAWMPFLFRESLSGLEWWWCN